MKTLLTAILLSLATTASALDLEVWGTKYIEPRNFGLVSSENPQFGAGVKISESFLWDRVSPYLSIETLMDGRVKESLAVADGFHPSSVKYVAGADVDLYRGIGVRVEHLCWHGIGTDVYTRGTQQYTSISIYYKFHADVK